MKGPILVLGAGPAGLAAAWLLAKRGLEVIVAERAAAVGGLAASFDLDGQSVDFGSHRLHPSCAPEILADIRGFLGEALLDRPRHGRIRLQGRWLHFPLQLSDILRNASRRFAMGALRDTLFKRSGKGGEESFASVLEQGLGPTICREFYYPYARKIWGVDAADLDPEQARRRVSVGSVGKLLQKVLGGSRKRFFYPRGGFGQISQAYAEAAKNAGARLLLETSAERITVGGEAVLVRGTEQTRLRPSLVLSTIPLPALVERIVPQAPREVLEAKAGLEYRSMILIYLVLATDRFTEFDAHYFPSEEILITRLSEPKNYGLNGVKGRTVLCAELPCGRHDSVWTASDDELGGVALESLKRAGIPYRGRVERVLTRRLAEAYPIYRKGFRERFELLDRWVEGLEGIVTLGRQGLFAHDNTHHTLAMAYAAVRCVSDTGFDHDSWSVERKAFEKFVVED